MSFKTLQVARSFIFLREWQILFKAVDDMLSLHSDFKYDWSTGRDVFDWWLGLDSGQLSFDGLSDLL